MWCQEGRSCPSVFVFIFVYLSFERMWCQGGLGVFVYLSFSQQLQHEGGAKRVGVVSCPYVFVFVFVYLSFAQQLQHEGGAKRVRVVRHNSTSAAHLNKDVDVDDNFYNLDED